MMLTLRSVTVAALFAGTAVMGSCSRPTDEHPVQQSPFPLSSVRLLDSPFLHAEKLNEAYVLAHDPDRLLAPFYLDAGLTPEAPRYGNWENSGLDGHTAGHYLTALAMMTAGSGNEEARERLEYMVDQLAMIQQKNGNGYVGGIPDGQVLWEEIAAGQIEAGNFSLNGRWVPWYNIHKLYAGLRDAWLFTGNEQALDVLTGLSDWAVDLAGNLTDEQIQEMLVSEHGGINEVFADVFEITGDERYLELARRFSHRAILDPLLAGEDRLTGLHANTQIPKVIGFQRTAEVGAAHAGNDGAPIAPVTASEDASPGAADSGAADSGTGDHIDARAWSDAAAFFWETVVKHRSVAIGGNSVREHFHPRDDFSAMVESREGPETCNTYNMMRLSRLLYFSTGELKYIDYYERALYNHILSSQHPGHGGLVYFSSMRPGHYRVYSNPEHTFWCCVGSGIENHAKYGELVYAHDGENLFVNLFIPTRLEWEERGTTVSQETNFPESEQTRLLLELEYSRHFEVNIRHPEWLPEGEMIVEVNGREIGGNSGPGTYFTIVRNWEDGDRISVTMPMHTYGEYLPDGLPYMALLHGPVVLAAETGSEGLEGLVADDSRMGHVAHGPLYPRQELPMLIIDDNEDWTSHIEPVDGEPLTFKAPELIFPPEEAGDLALIPFYRLHDARYIIYWQTAGPDEAEQRREELRRRDVASLELEAQTLDHVTAGQQQPETEHNFQGEDTETGIFRDRHWRHARGWFSYELEDPGHQARVLRLTYYGRDAGRHFDIYFNGQHLAEVELDGSEGDRFFDVNYALPTWVVEGNEEPVHTVRFEAREGSIAGGIYEVRLLR